MCMCVRLCVRPSVFFFLKYLYNWRIVTIKLHLIMELIPPLNAYVSFRPKLT